jgi:hypothetical protein
MHNNAYALLGSGGLHYGDERLGATGWELVSGHTSLFGTSKH